MLPISLKRVGVGGGGGTSQAVALLGLLKKEGIYFGSEVPFVS